MADVLSIATSGLTAASRQLEASASNIANASTTGRLPDSASQASTVYKPLHVSQSAVILGNGGGVQTQTTADPKGYSASYDPTDPNANANGLIAAPDVDLTQNLVNVIENKSLFKANLAVIKTEDQMTSDLLNTIA